MSTQEIFTLKLKMNSNAVY